MRYQHSSLGPVCAQIGLFLPRTDYWFDATGMTLESGAVSANYLRDPSGRLLWAARARPSANFGHDRLGSVTATLATNQTVSEAFRYDPWGSTISASSGVPLNRLRFTGARRDAGTGFYTLGQRHYAPSLARFTQLDPLPASVTDLNRHTYAGCNPVNYTDPTGTTAAQSCFIGLGQIGLGVAAAAATLVRVGLDRRRLRQHLRRAGAARSAAETSPVA